MVTVPSPPTYWLSMHVPYACRHSGACCASGWDIPVERTRVATLQSLRSDASWLRRAEGAPPDVAGVLALSDAGRCVFHSQGCEIHRIAGHAAMPTACQHFPREVLIDRRGVFVTLSHYCPTAADLLFSHVGPVEIVEGPPAVPGGEPEGLDAREVLPPVLIGEAGVRCCLMGSGVERRGQVSPVAVRNRAMLKDLEGYSAWEAHMVAVLTGGDRAAEEALASLEDDLHVLQQWRPGGQSLTEAVADLKGRRAVIAPLSPLLERRDPFEERVVRRYLAARAFASWDAYRPDGIAAILRSLRTTLAVLRGKRRGLPLKEAIRQTDLQVVHLRGRVTASQD